MPETRIRTARKGATATEYALIAALIAIMAIPAMITLADGNNQRADKAAHAMAGTPDR